MRNEKGQTATEYMIILAIVIIIALIVVGVLGGIPGIGRSTGGNTASAYWTTSEIGIPSYAVSNSSAGNNIFTMVLQNNKPSTITISNITVSTSGSTTADIQVSSGDIVLAAGGQQTVTGTGLGADICLSSGDSFASNVIITYTNDDTGVTYTFTGDGNRLEGTCGQ